MGDALTACAAARAGLSRPVELAFEVEDDDTGLPAAVCGHPVPDVEAFLGRARVIALGAGGLGDLLARRPDLATASDVGFCLCLADQDARRFAPDEPVDTRTARARLRADADERERIGAAMLELAELPVSPGNRRVYASGAAGLAAAIDDAAGAFARNQLSACVVGAVDSLVDAAALRFLYDAIRLKTPDDPNGLMPGEGAAFLLLERADWARQRRLPILARVAGTAVEQGEDPDVVERPPRGTALLSLFSRLLDGNPLPGDAYWVLSDQNGETYPALEWADFVIRAQGRLPDPAAEPLWYPAISFGDTGAASGALAACMAVRAFSRGYAPASTAIVVSGTYEGARSGLRLESPSARG